MGERVCVNENDGMVDVCQRNDQGTCLKRFILSPVNLEEGGSPPFQINLYSRGLSDRLE